jgi:hypothetical protein
MPAMPALWFGRPAGWRGGPSDCSSHRRNQEEEHEVNDDAPRAGHSPAVRHQAQPEPGGSVKPAQNGPLRTLLPLVLAAFAGACAGPAFRTGQIEAEVLSHAGQPTGRYSMPGGGQRLEYATGPMGRHTWMVDLDAQGRVLRWSQVLNEATFQQVTDGMSREELLRLIGRPAQRVPERMNRETWYWRYPTNDCLWFGVTVLPPDGRVQHGGGYMIDPVCDLPPGL